MLRADVLVGALWGDEGKGKYVGEAGGRYDAVLRVNASTNAGHCVDDGTHTYVTRQLPSVFFPRDTQLVIAPGALLNPVALHEELSGRPDLAALHGKLRVASSVSLVIRPYVEKGRGPMSVLIGSTHQGTGPSAVARAARHSLHFYDLQAAASGVRDAVLAKVRRTCIETQPLRFAADPAAHEAYYEEVLDELVEAFVGIEALVGPCCIDYSAFMVEQQASHPPRRFLIEGCNGMLLDNLHGAHPHTTSAPTNIGAMLCGANIPPACVDRVIVVMSAYATCLGKRPFPTELSAADAAHFYNNCNEVDVAEHNRRRLGWLDLPALRKALAGSAGAVLHMNKLDVLSGLRRIRVCTHYRIGDVEYAVLPDDPRLYARARAEYTELEGWSEPLGEVRTFDALPEKAQRYVRFVEGALPNELVSLGVGSQNDAVIRL